MLFLRQADENSQSMVIYEAPAKNTTSSPTDKQHPFLSSGVLSFAKSLDPDQNLQNFGPDLDSSCFDTDVISERIF